MGRAYSDDLRMKISAADERGEGSRRALAQRFGVSFEYVRKIRRHRQQTGSATRRPQSRYGVPSRMSEAVKAYLLAQVAAQTDITIAELRDQIEAEQGVSASWSSVRRWVLKLGLRLKKSRSTPANGTRKPTGSSASSSSHASARRRRRS
jgi:transposase